MSGGLIWIRVAQSPSLPPSHFATFLPEIPAVISVWIAVFGHHHPVGKLPPCQPLHGLLGVKN